MALLVGQALLHLFLLSFVFCNPIDERNTNQEPQGKLLWREQQDLYTQALVDYLIGNNDKKSYNAYFLNSSRKKYDIISIEALVEANCISSDDATSCQDETFVCNADLEYSSETNRYTALPGVNCKAPFDPNIPTTTTVISKSNYADLGYSSVNVNAKGVSTLVEMALDHIQSEHAEKILAVRVLEVARETVGGYFKYHLKFQVGLGTCKRSDNVECPLNENIPLETCLVEFHHMPVVSARTPLRNQVNIVSNNCTILQTSRNNVDNDIPVLEENYNREDMQATDAESPNESPNFDKMAESGQIDETAFIKSSRFSDLESQIIPTESTGSDIEIKRDNLPFVEATKSEIDNSQLGVEDIPSLPTSTDSFEEEKVQEMSPRKCSDENMSESSDEEEEEIMRKVKRQTRDTSESKTSEEKKPRTKRRAKKDSSSSSSSSSSDDDDDDNNNNNNNDDDKNKNDNKCNDKNDDEKDEDRRYECTKTKHKKVVPVKQKQSICDDDDNDNDKDSSSSSSSSSDEDNNNGKKNKCNNKNRKRRLIQLEDPFVKKLSKFAVDEMNTNDVTHRVIELLRVNTVELEGTLYDLDVKVSTASKCNELDGCDMKMDVNLCNLRIHVSDTLCTKLLQYKCSPIRDERIRRREIRVGGSSQIAKDDPKVLQISKDTLTFLDGDSASDYKFLVSEIHSATVQVVAGRLYVIHLEIGESNCTKGTKEEESVLCALKDEGAKKTCEIKFWEQPWLPNGNKANLTCGEEAYNYKWKRSISEEDQIKEHPRYEDFKDFVKKYEKVYDREEYVRRFNVFAKNMLKADFLNEKEQGTAQYGASIFADLTEEEFRTSRLGYKPSLYDENAIPLPMAPTPDIDLPTEMDWRKKGAVTEVKDQGSCGSCWAFSVTGNVEGQWAIKHGSLVELSEQELVDCDRVDDGCNGGLMDNAYRVIEQMGGLETEKDYPYDARDETCHFDQSLSKVRLSGAMNISHDEESMAKWLVKNGPISIAINANAMQLYMGGVSHPLKFLCSPKDLDHGVLIVGYGLHKYPIFNKILPYWIVKNSWGKSWGEQGYYRVYRGDGTCGVNQTPSSAIVSQD